MKKIVYLLMVASLFLGLFCAVGCIKPAKLEQFVEIAPHETAFMVPLESMSKSGQAQFGSIEFLNENKIAAKRVSLPLRSIKTGIGYWQIKYIPTAQVIKVSRTPVTREWTKWGDTGTTAKNDSIPVESLGSIGFSVPINITCSILEEDTAKFLYNYSGQQLEVIIDSNVRSWVTKQLSSRFGVLTLDACRADKIKIVEESYQKVIEMAKASGITIQSLSLGGGLIYDDDKIQDSINQEFKARNQKKINKEMGEATKIEKEWLLTNNDIGRTDRLREAENKRKEAEEFAKERQAQLEMRALEIAGGAMLKWDGKLPLILQMSSGGSDGSSGLGNLINMDLSQLKEMQK